MERPLRAQRALSFISAFLLACIAPGTPLFAAGPGVFPAGYHDHVASRLRYQPAVISAPRAKTLAFADTVHESGGAKTWIYVRDHGKEFHVRFAAGPEGSAPSPGDSLFRRSAERGIILDIRYELDPSIRSYMLLRVKNNDRTFLDVYANGEAVVKGVELKASIFGLFAVPISRIVDLAGNNVPWGLAFSAAGIDAVGDSD